MKWDPEQVDWLPVGAQELLRFACTRMVHSYKPVLMGILLDQLPAMDFPLATVTEQFVEFYLARERAGLPVERRGCRFVTSGRVEPSQCTRSACGVLVEVFYRLQRCLQVKRERVFLRTSEDWLPLADESTRPSVDRWLSKALSSFYECIELMGEAVYGRPQTHLTADAHEVVFLLPDPVARWAPAVPAGLASQGSAS